MTSENWYAEWFGELYDMLYASRRNPRQAADQAELLIRHLQLQPGTRMLDACCGNGRHLEHLQRKLGQNVVGFDLSLWLLEKARQKNLNNLLRADMRSLPFSNDVFDVVGSFFTSFGYFDHASDDLQALREYIRVLKPGGYLFLDLMNPRTVKEALPSNDQQQHPDYGTIVQKRYLKDNCVCKDIIVQNSEQKMFQEKVRLWTAQELEQENKNLKRLLIWGTESGDSFDPASSMRQSILWQKV